MILVNRLQTKIPITQSTCCWDHLGFLRTGYFVHIQLLSMGCDQWSSLNSYHYQHHKHCPSQLHDHFQVIDSQGLQY